MLFILRSFTSRPRPNIGSRFAAHIEH
jgi:hypothetical protein